MQWTPGCQAASGKAMPVECRTQGRPFLCLSVGLSVGLYVCLSVCASQCV